MEVTSRFKGLDLIDRMPEETQMEIHNTIQEAVTKIIPKKKKYHKAKWLSEEALQIAEKSREQKVKGGKERHTHLNAEFQRIIRRDNKVFLSEQCKDTEGNNRMGKTRDLFREIRDTKGTFPEDGMTTNSSLLAWRIPMDKGAWRTSVHGVTKSRTQLSD